MSERMGYQDMDPEALRVCGRRFSVQCTGQTNGAHSALIAKIKGIGHHEVYLNEDSDYDVMFCPVVSRVGTDVGEAMTKIRAGKQTILVVMHHTFDREHKVTKSSRHVDNMDVVLTVDCFFHDGKFLSCEQNEEAWAEIRTCLGAPSSIMVASENVIIWYRQNRQMVLLICAAILLFLLLVTLIVTLTKHT